MRITKKTNKLLLNATHPIAIISYYFILAIIGMLLISLFTSSFDIDIILTLLITMPFGIAYLIVLALGTINILSDSSWPYIWSIGIMSYILPLSLFVWISIQRFKYKNITIKLILVLLFYLILSMMGCVYGFSLFANAYEGWTFE